jgi:nitrate reductase gamma subunit
VTALIDFAGGPLFRFCFALMVLGLLRILILEVWGAVEAHRRAGDPKMPWGLAIRRTLQWLFPVKRGLNQRPIYSVISIIFHVGLILVPLFLYAHVQLWKGALGFGWFTLSEPLADVLTVTTIIGAVALLIGRIGSRTSRFLSRKQDYLWPLLLLVPFVTGYVCANLGVGAGAYQTFMLIHILAGNLILLLLPFTKIAHCVLMPFSQFVMTIAWRFPAETDDKVCTTLGKKGAPV